MATLGRVGALSLVALAGYGVIYATLLVGLAKTVRVPLPEWVWGFVLAKFAVFFW